VKFQLLLLSSAIAFDAPHLLVIEGDWIVELHDPSFLLLGKSFLKWEFLLCCRVIRKV
jgi:hypothetical protein